MGKGGCGIELIIKKKISTNMHYFGNLDTNYIIGINIEIFLKCQFQRTKICKEI
jgi:hypothetical protein